MWWLDGEPTLVGVRPDTPDRQPQPYLAQIRPPVAAPDCRFVTTDVARRADCAWRVVVVGDGQVSDLPRTLDPAAVIGPLMDAS